MRDERTRLIVALRELWEWQVAQQVVEECFFCRRDALGWPHDSSVTQIDHTENCPFGVLAELGGELAVCTHEELVEATG